MKELIKITNEEGSDRQLVDARELWKGLESKRDFSNWIKAKVVGNAFFEENVDWMVYNICGKNPLGGRPTKDYALTIDTAKKVAMSEQTEKGNEVRDYFLKCEKKLIEVQKVLPANYIDALKQLIISEEAKQKVIEENKTLQIENKELTSYIEENQPKLDYLDTILNSNDALLATQIATDYDLSATKLNKILHEQGVQWKTGNQWILYNKYRNKGLIKTDMFTIKHKNGKESIKSLTKWTQQGRLLIHEILVGLGIEPINDILNSEEK